MIHKIFIIIVMFFLVSKLIYAVNKECAVSINPAVVELSNRKKAQLIEMENFNNFTVSYTAILRQQPNRLSNLDLVNLNLSSNTIINKTNITIYLNDKLLFNRTNYIDLLIKFEHCNDKVIPISIKPKFTIKKLFSIVGLRDYYNESKVAYYVRRTKQIITNAINTDIIKDVKIPSTNIIFNVKGYMFNVIFLPLTLLLFWYKKINKITRVGLFILVNVVVLLVPIYLINIL